MRLRIVEKLILAPPWLKFLIHGLTTCAARLFPARLLFVLSRKTSKHIVHLQQQKNRFLVVYHRKAIKARWQSQYSTARLEGFTSIFQAARAGARGYRNPKTFVAMIYRIRSPVDNIIKST
jgi:hypothetical protein